MILSDKSIKEKIGKEIFISPYSKSNVQPASYDLHLGDEFVTFKKGQLIDPSKDVSNIMDKKTVVSPFILEPHGFVLAVVKEKIGVDSNHVGRLEGKSSLGRLGLFIHATAGFLDPGNNLNLTLELYNATNNPIKLYPGMKIAQIAFETLDTECEKPYGTEGLKSKYVGDKTVTPSKGHENFQTARTKQFESIMDDCKKLFIEKNIAYGDDFFSGGYSESERWMSIKRKIARLTAKYEKGNKGMPDETIKDTWMDLANYCIMEMMILEGGKE